MERKYNVYLSTHQGYVRSDNEDNYAINTVVKSLNDSEKNLRGMGIKQPLVCSVFDGMGGEANGEIASKIGADNATQLYKNLLNVDSSIDDEVARYVTKTNNDIVSVLANGGTSRGGSTFVTAVIDRGYVYPYSLGDSRMYLYRDGQLKQLTEDHTLAMKKYRANIYTLEEAKNSTDSHKLTSFMGIDLGDGVLEPQSYPAIKLQENDKLLLCSDGLYDMCSDDEILRIISRNSKVVSLTLVEQALKNGGQDNVTCMVIECSEE